jgi:ankyrin repeat protein
MKTFLLLVFAFALSMSLSVEAAEIHDAAGNGDMATIKSLLSENPDLVNVADEKGSTPLHSACNQDNRRWLRFCLKKVRTSKL